MLIFSHRGYHVTAPENTLDAFAQAVDLGVDGIETDLRITSDGAVVLFHDRQTPDGREVSEVSHAELIRAVNYSVPSLDEALARFDNVTWNLEIKVAEARIPCLAAIERYASGNCRFLVTSFLHHVVAEFAADLATSDIDRSRVEIGLLTADRPLSLDALLGSMQHRGTTFDAIVWYFDIVDRELLAEARRRGIANDVYGVKTVADHRRCLELGLDAVITDRPEFVAQARSAQRPTSAT